ncbi:hypothetical protein PAXRUDRAFT_808009 [Paxillus rubicundulus Ve08.2h10]|uniref:Uncharacterized protein n=1 Tax=Paxillus rubicundulus Ve08.2h10 TaxID=930991 RepID=A0A0D0DBH2_9AGAM|nr:hypothetical protein PAXRUDRAFT_808009 [Paxillus rubicundulus Ve08.2h10]
MFLLPWTQSHWSLCEGACQYIQVIYCNFIYSYLQWYRFTTHSHQFMDAYSKRLSGKQAVWASKKYRGHCVYLRVSWIKLIYNTAIIHTANIYFLTDSLHLPFIEARIRLPDMDCYAVTFDAKSTLHKPYLRRIGILCQ